MFYHYITTVCCAACSRFSFNNGRAAPGPWASLSICRQYLGPPARTASRPLRSRPVAVERAAVLILLLLFQPCLGHSRWFFSLGDKCTQPRPVGAGEGWPTVPWPPGAPYRRSCSRRRAANVRARCRRQVFSPVAVGKRPHLSIRQPFVSRPPNFAGNAPQAFERKRRAHFSPGPSALPWVSPSLAVPRGEWRRLVLVCWWYRLARIRAACFSASGGDQCAVAWLWWRGLQVAPSPGSAISCGPPFRARL